MLLLKLRMIVFIVFDFWRGVVWNGKGVLLVLLVGVDLCCYWWW